mmetsp:Transcript_45165/g.130797  ORF Transcript_45165/g.130797 Transcript_45165/m.130797 type:complete len:307 (+) Transcript_45165:234-1154(+)
MSWMAAAGWDIQVFFGLRQPPRAPPAAPQVHVQHRHGLRRRQQRGQRGRRLQELLRRRLLQLLLRTARPLLAVAEGPAKALQLALLDGGEDGAFRGGVHLWRLARELLPLLLQLRAQLVQSVHAIKGVIIQPLEDGVLLDELRDAEVVRNRLGLAAKLPPVPVHELLQLHLELLQHHLQALYLRNLLIELGARESGLGALGPRVVPPPQLFAHLVRLLLQLVVAALKRLQISLQLLDLLRKGLQLVLQSPHLRAERCVRRPLFLKLLPQPLELGPLALQLQPPALELQLLPLELGLLLLDLLLLPR